MGLVIVPEKTAYVVERFGKYNTTLGAGLHFLLPVVSCECGVLRMANKVGGY